MLVSVRLYSSCDVSLMQVHARCCVHAASWYTCRLWCYVYKALQTVLPASNQCSYRQAVAQTLADMDSIDDGAMVLKTKRNLRAHGSAHDSVTLYVILMYIIRNMLKY